MTTRNLSKELIPDAGYQDEASVRHWLPPPDEHAPPDPRAQFLRLIIENFDKAIPVRQDLPRAACALPTQLTALAAEVEASAIVAAVAAPLRGAAGGGGREDGTNIRVRLRRGRAPHLGT
jgi:hypothetical protein